MPTLKEMIIEILKKQNKPMSAKDLTIKLIKMFPKKFQDKKIHFKNDEQKARDQIKREIHRNTISNDNTFFRDKSFKPLKIGLIEQNDEMLESELEDEDFESENGLVYILATNTFTKEGKELVKIGITTRKIEDRINNLYKTNTPFKYTVLREYNTSSYEPLEKAMHNLLTKFRPNLTREFFTKDCLEFADEIFELHKKIVN